MCKDSLLLFVEKTVILQASLILRLIMNSAILKQVFLIILFSFNINLFAQSAPISIDGVYDDWTSNLATFADPVESVSGIDILEMQVSNDEDFLFIRLKIDTEIDLTTDLVPQGIMLHIDADNDPTTGHQVQNGYGSELGVVFRDRYAYFNVVPNSNVSFSDIRMRPAPTVTSNEFEIAIGRDVLPDGVNSLFTADTIRILFTDTMGGDNMPNSGTVFYYTFDETPVTPLIPTELTKENENYIRVVAYNTLWDGFLDAERLPFFENIISILNPDIIGFSECGSTSPTYVKTLFDQWLPLGNSNGWYVSNDYSGDLITLSRWPILQVWRNLYRQFPVLIELPEMYQTDLLFTNSHLRCCDANYERQEQVDEYVAFMLDAQNPGGSVNIAQDTPFIYAGDLNLVGFAQQLTTLITGDIQNTASYGQGSAYDWDNTEVTDQICQQSDKRMAYTWRDDYGSYPAGRLDYIIYSDAVMEAEKSFTIQTEVMPTDRLQEYGLYQFDTSSASDHFPVVTDFSINAAIGTSTNELTNSIVYPNPTKGILCIQNEKVSDYELSIYDSRRIHIKTFSAYSQKAFIDLEFLSSGIYFLQIRDDQGNRTWKKVLKE